MPPSDLDGRGVPTGSPHIQPPKRARQIRPSSASGAGSPKTTNREDVTPWEFQALDPIPLPGVKPKITPPASPPRRPKTSSAALASLTFSPIPPPIIPLSSSSSVGATVKRDMPTMTTGPIADVTPWELYPAPRRPRSTSASLASTTGDTRNIGLSSQSTSTSNPMPQITIPTTSTGPVEDVTPWELAPGPAGDDASAPASPSSGSNKIMSIFKSKPDPKVSKRTSSPKSPSSPNFTPLPDPSMESLDNIPTAIPPLSLQRSLATALKASMSEHNLPGSKHSVQSHGFTPSDFKWSRSGSRGGKDRKGLSSNAPVAERTRQQPLTGPVEDVAPWEMQPPPHADKKITISVANLAHISPSNVMSPTIEMWKLQKSAGRSKLVKRMSADSHYAHRDGRSMSSSALPLSTMGLRRARANSVATTCEAHYIGGERTVASTTSLPLYSGRSSRDDSATTVDKEGARRSRDASALIGILSRGRSLTGETATSSRSGVRPLSSSASASGHGEKFGATSMISTMNVTQMEEVIPWELYPTPVPFQQSSTTVSGTTNEEKDRKTPRTSTSSAAGKALVELGLRKRRSTGKTIGTSTPGGGRVHSTSGTSFIANKDSVPVPSFPGTSSGMATKAISSTLLPISVVPSTSSTSSAQSRGSRSTTGKEKGPASNTQTSEPTTSDTNRVKFSTADRTILEELKANIRAREAQFVIKGVGHAMVGGRRCPGKKYHPHRKTEVPYPRSYDREVVDLDVWETMFWLDLCKGLSWHSFEKAPTKVLEIGCGTGTWILEAARTWKSCNFVGLDIVPLHPNLKNFASFDVTSRVTWVQHNFLDGLPFQNEEFDFVHIKRIALGIPEDKWDRFLEEVQRVMKPGGAFEMIEEDLFFPGKPIDDNDDISATSPVTKETPSSTGTTALGLRPMPQIDEQTIVKSFADNDATREAHNAMHTTQRSGPLDLSDDSAPRNPRDHTILETIWHGMLESRFVNSAPLSLLPTYLEYHFQGVRTHPPLLYSIPPLPDKQAEAKKVTSSARHNAVNSQPAPKSPTIQASSSNHLNDGLPSSMKNLGKHSLYVALDETRSDALSPSNLAPSPKRTKDAKGHSATLPDHSLSVDIRTLNLHLALRAKEIVACSEPMWEWVEEFQLKQARRPRFRSDSIEVALLGSTRAFNGRDADVLIKDVIVDMTRDDFDQILTNFQLDMQDKTSIKNALEQRFDWKTFTSEPLLDRKAFDTACQRHDEWLATETRSRLSRNDRPLGNDISIHPITDGVKLSADASLRNTAPSLSSHLLPRQLLSCQQQLSRAMRVFVAWKESS